MDLVSVIIPAYNAEKYIERCVNSVTNQTYQNLEIIVINDGSTDDTKMKVEKMFQHDDRIMLINKKNEGVSSARNDGIKKSSGKYIYFIDSDDYISENTIEELYTAMIDSKGCMPVCGFVNVYDNQENTEFSLYNEKTVLSRKDYMIIMSQYLYSVYFGALWNKLYDAAKIKNNNIKFDESVFYAEDFIFNLQYIEYISKMIMVPEKYYFYYQGNSNSLTKNNDVWEKWRLAKERMEYCIKEYKKMGSYNEDNKRNIYTALSNEVIAPTYDTVMDNSIKKRVAIKKIKEIYSSNLVKEAIKYTNRYNMVHRIAKLSLNLNNYSLFYYLMKMWIPIQKRFKKVSRKKQRKEK